MKDDVIEYLKENGLWYECGIYVNGKRYAYDESAQDEIRIDEDIDAADYLDYYREAGNIFAMYFEGSLNHVLNGYADGIDYDKFYDEFNEMFSRLGLYYEFGDSWNFSCYLI